GVGGREARTTAAGACAAAVRHRPFAFFFFQAEDGIRDYKVTGVQTCALPIYSREHEPEYLLGSEANWLGVHPDVLKLGLVSFLTDVSSEMIFSVFAVFFTTIAGASSDLMGLVEGFSDFSASSLDYVDGWMYV